MHVRAICFDYGGTLDGPASHWLDRFLALYHRAGLALTFERFRKAFDHATRCGYAETGLSGVGLQALVEFHVARQMEHLQLRDPAVAEQIVTAFVRASRLALEESRGVLGRLREHAALGVISNFYGNVDRILTDEGLAPLLDVIIDSGAVGVHKPDPAIFELAARGLLCETAEILYVGDSFEKDVVGACAAGMRTAWLVGATERACRAPELVDVRLRSLADLEAILQ